MKQKKKSFRRKQKNNKKSNKKKTKKVIIKGGSRILTKLKTRLKIREDFNPFKAIGALIVAIPVFLVTGGLCLITRPFQHCALMQENRKIQERMFGLNKSHRKRIKKFKKKIKEYKKRIKELELKKKNDYSWADSPASKMHETYLNSVRELEQEKNKLERELKEVKNKLEREVNRGEKRLQLGSYYFNVFNNKIDNKYVGDDEYARTINFLIQKIINVSRAIAILKFSDKKKRRYFSNSPRDEAFDTIERFIETRIKTINKKISDSRKNGSENLGEITYNEYLKLLKLLIEKIKDYLSILNKYVIDMEVDIKDRQVHKDVIKMFSGYEPIFWGSNGLGIYLELHKIDVNSIERVLGIVNEILPNEEESDNIENEFNDKINGLNFENMYIAEQYPLDEKEESDNPLDEEEESDNPLDKEEESDITSIPYHLSFIWDTENENVYSSSGGRKELKKLQKELKKLQEELKKLQEEENLQEEEKTLQGEESKRENLKKQLETALYILTKNKLFRHEYVQLIYGGANEEKKQYGGNLNSINVENYTNTLTELKKSNSLPKAINNIKKLMNNNLYRFFGIMYGIPQDISDYADEEFELPPKYIELIDSNIKLMNDIYKNLNQQESKETVTEGSLNKKIQDLENSQDISSFFTNYYEIMIGIKKLKQNEKVNVGSLITETNIAYMNFIKTKFPEIITQIRGLDREKKEVWEEIISEQKNEDDDVSSEKIAQIFLIDLVKKSELNLSKIRQFFIDCKANPTMDSKQSCRGTLQSLSIDNKIRYEPLNFQQTNPTIFNNDNIIERMKQLANTLFPGVTEIIDDMEISEDNGEQDAKLEQEEEQEEPEEEQEEPEEEQQQEEQEQQTTGGKKSRKTRKRRKRHKSRKRRKRNKSRKRRKRHKSRKRRKRNKSRKRRKRHKSRKRRKH